MDFSLQIAPDLHTSSFFLVDRYDFCPHQYSLLCLQQDGRVYLELLISLAELHAQ